MCRVYDFDPSIASTDALTGGRAGRLVETRRLGKVVHSAPIVERV